MQSADIQPPHPRRQTPNRGRSGWPAAALAALLAPFIVVSGCASVVTNAAERMTQNLAAAILDQDDPKTVQDGAPAYLLLVDGLIEDDPDNVRLLRAGAGLYGSYAGVFVDDTGRARRLTAKARAYGERALCRTHPAACGMHARPYDEFVQGLQVFGRADVPVLYDYGAAWAGWIQAHQGDWTAVAEVPKVEAVMRRVVELDESHDRGGPHLYLGVLASLLPPALGGRPEDARRHMERAFELSGRRNLMARVMLAERYARPLFDRALHDRVLHEVLAADAHAPGLTLMNTIAKQKAAKLLETADRYF